MVQIVEYMLKYDVDCNVQDKNGWTPLHRAARCAMDDSMRKLMEIMLRSGASCNIKDRKRLTPPHIAFFHLNKDDASIHVRIWGRLQCKG